jgi:glycosyltransferase involved in cell wall biosynthesis
MVLPIVASNFVLYKEIVEGNKCGITVDATNPKEIARAVEYLIEHPNEARKMGENGKKAILEKYNWEREGRKLLEIYSRVLDNVQDE